ncbi:hypothetical protein BKA66DRAFT_581970, partial [Pyrenochaeta sp. MPI-SDFR-AT-0127]
MSPRAQEATFRAATHGRFQQIGGEVFNPTGSPDGQVKVIGIYGISGAGKSFTLNKLKEILGVKHFCFYEGSELIAEVVPGGLAAFQEQDEQTKTVSRQLAINKVHEYCFESGKTAIVTGHFMFWPEHHARGHAVYTKSDLSTYTHILYLNVPAQVIEQRCHDDAAKQRQPVSAAHLLKWQKAEQTQLRSLCREHSILFSLINSDRVSPSAIGYLIRDLDIHNENYNSAYAERKLDQVVSSHLSRAETVLVLDADRTLGPQDTGDLFWRRLFEIRNLSDKESPLKPLFSGPLGYSYTGFRQAALLHEEAVGDQEYEDICQHVASEVTIHPEFVSLLQILAETRHAGAVVVSCGLRRVWEIVLEKAGLRETVEIIAGGRIADGIVVTAAVKATLVARLQDYHQKRVWAFGDSTLDLEMLKEADQAFVVAGDHHTRSKTMDAALSEAINQDGLCARQVLLPSTAPPRLDTARLPIADMTRVDFISSLFRRNDQTAGILILLATNTNAAKLLATPMRDAAVGGPQLRRAHEQAGWYLAYEYLPRIIGLEACPISHVLGHATSGFRLSQEHRTTIVALMRGGD